MPETRPVLPELIHEPARGALTLDGARYVLVRAETLAALHRAAERVVGPAGAAAILREAGRAGGGSAAAAYSAAAADPRALADRMAMRGTALGWGALRVERVDARVLRVTAAHSPFAEACGRAEAPVCHLLTGALEALGDRVFGPGARAIEERCAATGAAACAFDIVPGR